MLKLRGSPHIIAEIILQMKWGENKSWWLQHSTKCMTQLFLNWTVSDLVSCWASLVDSSHFVNTGPLLLKLILIWHNYIFRSSWICRLWESLFVVSCSQSVMIQPDTVSYFFPPWRTQTPEYSSGSLIKAHFSFNNSSYRWLTNVILCHLLTNVSVSKYWQFCFTLRNLSSCHTNNNYTNILKIVTFIFSRLIM